MGVAEGKEKEKKKRIPKEKTKVGRSESAYYLRKKNGGSEGLSIRYKDVRK